MAIRIKLAEQISELTAILELQRRNFESSLAEEEMQKQGFVTVKHDLPLLIQMNADLASVIAIEEEKLIGYTLSMTKRFRNDIAILIPMFDLIDSLDYQGYKLKDVDYLVGGQICIDKAYRSQGLFRKLYEKARDEFSDKYRLMLTEVSDRNPRSVRAHLNIGFESIHSYRMDEREEWSILAWNWNL